MVRRSWLPGEALAANLPSALWLGHDDGIRLPSGIIPQSVRADKGRRGPPWHSAGPHRALPRGTDRPRPEQSWRSIMCHGDEPQPVHPAGSAAVRTRPEQSWRRIPAGLHRRRQFRGPAREAIPEILLEGYFPWMLSKRSLHSARRCEAPDGYSAGRPRGNPRGFQDAGARTEEGMQAFPEMRQSRSVARCSR
jgi:hypothetical protein